MKQDFNHLDRDLRIGALFIASIVFSATTIIIHLINL